MMQERIIRLEYTLFLLQNLAQLTRQPIALAWLESDDHVEFNAQQVFTGQYRPELKRQRRIYYAMLKALEAFVADIPLQIDTPMAHPYITTPTAKYGDISLDQAGGIGHFGNYVGVSGLSAMADQFVAALLLRMYEFNEIEHKALKMYVHHMGIRTTDRAQYDEWIHNLTGRAHEYHNHVSFFYRVDCPGDPLIREVMFYPEGPHDNSVHIDMAFPTYNNAMQFINWFREVTGIPPTDLSADSHSGTIGSFWCHLEGDNQLGIIIRTNSWSPFI